MASIFTHSFVGLSAALLMPKKWQTPTFITVATIAPSLPDLDVLGFYAGIPYESFFGHRGFFHSILFSFILGAVLAKLIIALTNNAHQYAFAKLTLFMGGIITTHGLLDAMTTGGEGIALLSPFYIERIFFPWRMIKVSPMHIDRFFSEWGLGVLKSEFQYVWLPLLIVLATKFLFMRKTS